MACCPCCCTQQNGVCCGTGEEKVCCKAPRECCTVYTLGFGESDVCCTETQYCCNDGQGVCCEVGQICCVGDLGAVCCESNVVCCAGVCCAEGECCVDDVCVPCECETDEDCPEGECCNGGVCGECADECEADEDCGYCSGIIGPFQQYTQCVPAVIGGGCQDCEVLADLCAELGGSYFRSNDPVFDFCTCQNIVLPTSEANCTAFNAAYNGSFTFENGHCCDNQCQYEPCDEAPP